MAPGAHRLAAPTHRSGRAAPGGWQRIRWVLLTAAAAWVLAGCPQGGGGGAGGGGGY